MKRTYWLICGLVAFTISSSALYIYTKNSEGNNGALDGESSKEEILKILYNDSELGYNSMVWYGINTPIGIPEKYPFVDISNMVLPVYEYDAFILTDDTINALVKKYFPHINMNNMDLIINKPSPLSLEYLTIENESYKIELFSHGGITYLCKRDLLRTIDNIKSPDIAKALALDYLENHGGIPDDILTVSSFGFTTWRPEGKNYNGSYWVQIYRDVGDFSVQGATLRNRITLIFDSGNKELIEFSYHWPELTYSFNISEFAPIDEILNFYKMNSSSDNRANITNLSIVYRIPLSLHCNAYNVSAEKFFLAPYWRVSTDDSRTYYLGIIIPEKV